MSSLLLSKPPAWSLNNQGQGRPGALGDTLWSRQTSSAPHQPPRLDSAWLFPLQGKGWVPVLGQAAGMGVAGHLASLPPGSRHCPSARRPLELWHWSPPVRQMSAPSKNPCGKDSGTPLAVVLLLLGSANPSLNTFSLTAMNVALFWEWWGRGTQ